MNDQRHSVGSHRPSLRPCPEESLGEYLIIDLIHAKTRFQVSGLVFSMITKSEFDQERFNLVLGFELKLCRIKLRKCIMQRNAVFLGKSFFMNMHLF